MRGELVALDLETTGLDSSTDHIIEVGLVRLLDGKIADEFSTLINPGSTLPSHITHITGIQHDDLIGKPPINSVLPRISEFIGGAPVIAHNINFDMSFLRERHRILPANRRIDTYDLAAILLPDAPRYNLNSLTQLLGIELDQAHRALDDARATALLYWNLWERTLALPTQILAEIARANARIDWETGLVFEAALKESRTATFKQANNNEALNPVLDTDSRRPIQPQNGPPSPIEYEELAELLGPNGAFATQLETYEHRPQQLEIASNIAQAFYNSEQLMIEASTGVGKTISYLIPAILWAMRNKQRVVISTQTINLQEQLLKRDLPLVKKLLDVEIETAVLKGRSHYLSPQRLDVMKRRGPTTATELRTYAKILVWQLTNKSGDKGEINLRGRDENEVWDQLSAEYAIDEVGSPYQTAKRNAELAHLIVVNHSLLVSDTATDNSVIPEYQYLIIDEAHHLEEATTQGFQAEISYHMIQRLITQLGTGKSGILGEIRERVKQGVANKTLRRLEQFIDHTESAIQIMGFHLKRLFELLGDVLIETSIGREGDFSLLLRITIPVRDSPRFMEVQHTWLPLAQFFDGICGALAQFIQAVRQFEPVQAQIFKEHASQITQIAHQLEEIRHQLESFITRPDDNLIYWIRALNTDEYPTIVLAPLHAGKLAKKSLWSKKKSVILLSATLRSGDNFDFIKERLHADHMSTLEISSPFNYLDSTMIYLPTDIPEPAQREDYQQAVERSIIEVAAALDGRVMALFTSYSQLRQTAQAISARLALGNITVFDQSDGTSRDSLLEGFRSTEKAVLLGTRSFWEGVDIPGDDLSCLMIARLPFSVPSDPIFSARSDTYNNAFSQYALPEAILRFRQGFGRLIRRKSDRGIIVIMDKRIISKGYGNQFLDALPNCTIKRGPLKDVGDTARSWLART